MKHDESTDYMENIGPSEFDRLNSLIAKTVGDFERGYERVLYSFQECFWQNSLIELKREMLSKNPDQEIKEHILQLEKRIAIIEYLANEAERFLINSGLALKAIKGNDALVNTMRDESPAIQIDGLRAQEYEKRRIARDIHDGPAQNIAGMLLKLDIAKRTEGINGIKKEIEDIEDLGKKCLAELRHIIFDLKPPFLKPGPFSASISNYFEDYKSTYRFQVDYLFSGDLDEIDYFLRTALFRLVQEGINNSRKHSGEDKAFVKIMNSGELITLLVKDDGRGFDVNEPIKGTYGISGMEERVREIKGEMRIISSPGAGTMINIKAPVERKGRSYEKDQGIDC